MEPNDEQTIEMHAIVHGQVQGIGFRATVQRCAVELGLLGTTRNLHDGTVEIHVQGSRKKVARLFRELHKEFGPEYISSIIQKEAFPHNKYDGFRIGRTG